MSDALSEQAAGMMLWLGNRSKEETLSRILWLGLLDGVIVTADNLDDPLVDGLACRSSHGARRAPAGRSVPRATSTSTTSTRPT